MKKILSALLATIIFTMSIAVTSIGTEPEIPIEKIILEQTEYRLKSGDMVQIVISIQPNNATNTTLISESSNPNVAIFENGSLCAKSKGTTIITLFSENKSASASFIVMVDIYVPTVENFRIWENKYSGGTFQESIIASHTLDVSWYPVIYGHSYSSVESLKKSYDVRSIVYFDVVSSDGSSYTTSCHPQRESYGYFDDRLEFHVPTNKTYTITATLELYYVDYYIYLGQEVPRVVNVGEYVSDPIEITLSSSFHYNTTFSDEYLATPATCGSPAQYYENCEYCGVNYDKLIRHGEKDPNNHTFTEWSYYSDECHIRICECSALSEIKEHSLIEHDQKSPTCVEAGWEIYNTCSDCNYTTYAEISATGEHTGGTATCTSKAVCDSCHNEYGEINSENHSETEIRNFVEPTKNTEGYSGDTYCKDCGTKLSDGEVIPILSTPGDANNDGNINLNDITLILKFIAKWDGLEIDTEAADVTGDGTVNLSDVTLLLQYIAKWNVTLK